MADDTVNNKHRRETDVHGHQQTAETDDGTNTEDKNSERDIKEEDNRSANESVPHDQGNTQLLDNNYVKPEEQTDANTEPREVVNIGKTGGSLSGQARIHVVDKREIDCPRLDEDTAQVSDKGKDVRSKVETDDHTKTRNDVIVGESDGSCDGQANIQKPDDKNEVSNEKYSTDHLLQNCYKDDSSPNEIPKKTESIEQTIDNTEENQRLQNLKEMLSSSRKENENLKNEVGSLKGENANLKSAGEAIAEKDMKIQVEVMYLKELNTELLKRMVEKDKEIEKSKTIIQKLEEEISKIKRENVRNVTEMNMQTKRLLQDADQIQKNLEKKCKTLQNEIEGKTNQLQWLTSRFNQEKEGYLQQVQILTAEKKDLLLRMVEKDKEIEKSKTIIQKQKYEISKIGGLESQITKKDKEIEKAKKEIGKQKTEISKIKRENDRQLAEMSQQRDWLLQNAEQYQKNLEKTLNSEIEEKKNQIQWLVSSFKQEKEGYHQQVQVLTAEKTDLLLRLNKVASANMTYNNPNIADLSYEKRPTKLAEEFSDLYDNEWTDAFEEIEGENEEDKLTFILELLKRANQLCLDLSNEHTRKVKQSISTLTILMPRKQEQNNTNGSSDDDKLRQSQQEQNLPESIEQEKRNQDDTEEKNLGTAQNAEAEDTANTERVKAKDGSESQTEGECLEEKKGDMIESQKTRLESDFEKLRTEQKKTILEATKYFETLLSEDVKKAVTEVIVNEKGIDDEKQKCVVVYIENCIDLCWSMLRHKPPVHVDLPDITSDIPFDTNKYKPYTKTGKHLAYIVWPALYLHEGGSLLSKGVAQGK